MGTEPDSSEMKDGKSSVSETLDALPGIYRVGIPVFWAPRLTLAGGANYGFTEPQNGEESAHHRIGASLAAGVVPFSFGAAALRFDFRHDMHGEDPLGSDSGTIMDLTPILRAGGQLSPGLHLGGEVRGRFSGAVLASGIPTPEMEARAMFGYTKVPGRALAFQLGYRLGQRGDVVDEAANLRPGDRVALGISEYDALLVGLGASKRYSNTEILGELSWDIFLGSEAPSAAQSPFRISGGIRQHLSRSLSVQGNVEVLPLGRAPSLTDSPLVPIEPRFTLQAGLVYSFGKKEAPPPPAPKPMKAEEKKKVAPKPVVNKVDPGSLQVTVVDASGHPISDALVTLEFEAEGGGAAERRVVPLRNQNIYVLEEILPGEGTLRVVADLLRDHQRKVTIVEAQPLEVDVRMSSEGSVGAQLRGLVRAYSGEGLKASVRVEPGAHEVICNQAGEFEIGLPPGNYEVIISAEGYSEQRRKLSVGEEGVTVLNADLQSSTP